MGSNSNSNLQGSKHLLNFWNSTPAIGNFHRAPSAAQGSVSVRIQTESDILWVWNQKRRPTTTSSISYSKSQFTTFACHEEQKMQTYRVVLPQTPVATTRQLFYGVAWHKPSFQAPRLEDKDSAALYNDRIALSDFRVILIARAWIENLASLFLFLLLNLDVPCLMQSTRWQIQDCKSSYSWKLKCKSCLIDSAS